MFLSFLCGGVCLLFATWCGFTAKRVLSSETLNRIEHMDKQMLLFVGTTFIGVSTLIFGCAFIIGAFGG